MNDKTETIEKQHEEICKNHEEKIASAELQHKSSIENLQEQM